MIAIIDYGVCNVGSVQNMFRRAGVLARAVTDPAELREAERLILPGVGNFCIGMENLQARGFADAIGRAVFVERKPLLGICLGMQLLAEHGDEGGCAGLGFIRGRVVRFKSAVMAERLPIPHMGWNTVRPAKASPLFTQLPEIARFYFIHSYHFEPTDGAAVLAWTDYGYPFVSAVQSGLVFGVQFHPEKSHVFGKQLLKRFAEARFDA